MKIKYPVNPVHPVKKWKKKIFIQLNRPDRPENEVIVELKSVENLDKTH